jgi:hypothetical protein
MEAVAAANSPLFLRKVVFHISNVKHIISYILPKLFQYKTFHIMKYLKRTRKIVTIFCGLLRLYQLNSVCA